MKFVTVALLLVATALALCWTVEAKNSVRMQDIQVLTFTRGEKTEGRRRSGVPQLRCVGGAAKGQYEPHTAMCKNIGFDGTDVAWKCEANLPSEFSLGKVTVTCEGFDRPDDEYVLKDSCGLEYNLEYSELGKQTGYHPEDIFSTFEMPTIEKNRGLLGNIFYTIRNIITSIVMLPWNIVRWVVSFFYKGTTTFLKLITAGVALVIGLSIFKGFSSARNRKQTTSTGRAPYTARAAPGGLAGGSDRESSGPGFWSGMVGGGLLSYYLNRRKNNQSTSAGVPPPVINNRPVVVNPNEPGAYPATAVPGGEHQSEAYGRTERR